MQDNSAGDDAGGGSSDAPGGRESSRLSSSRIKILVLLIVVGVAAVVFFSFRDQLSLAGLAEQEARLRQFQREHPAAVYGAAFLIYATLIGLSLPLAGGLTLAFGWYFGFWQTVILVSFASTTGSTLAFLLSRYLLRGAIERRFGDRLRGFNEALRREGAFYLFTLRLVVVVPLFVINVVMGLTPMRVGTFWWVSQLGMLPGTCVYVYAGSVVPTLQELAEKGTSGIFTWEILVAFALLGIFPLAVKKLLGRLRPRTQDVISG